MKNHFLFYSSRGKSELSGQIYISRKSNYEGQNKGPMIRTFGAEFGPKFDYSLLKPDLNG